MTDSIRLSGIEAYAYHGVYVDEQERGQVFVVDVEVFMDLSVAASSDDLASTLHYGHLAQAIRDRVAGERWDLIERVAERVAELVLEDSRVEAVEVTVHKPSAPIEVVFSDVTVTIRRSQ